MKKCSGYHENYKNVVVTSPKTGERTYHKVKTFECWGTKERDKCTCGGDECKCDFYPEVREKAKEKKLLEELKSDITYYVVKDKNTGLYFRGKGVNKWGKYYNQASIYRIKGYAEETVEEEGRRGADCVVIPIQIIEKI